MFLKFFKIVAIVFLFILAFIAFEWIIGVFFTSMFISVPGAIIATVVLAIAYIISLVEDEL